MSSFQGSDIVRNPSLRFVGHTCAFPAPTLVGDEQGLFSGVLIVTTPAVFRETSRQIPVVTVGTKAGISNKNVLFS